MTLLLWVQAGLCYLQNLKTVCSELGVPLAPLASQKQDNPISVIVFLEIVIDTK